LFFVYYGNLVIEPIWWESLQNDKKEYLENLLRLAMVDIDLALNLALNDSIQIGDWQVVEKKYLN